MFTNSKNTKRALVSSTIALIVCISMLIGSTYAWFTDSVSGSNNIIKSGNLDIELKYSTDLAVWNDVTEGTNIFMQNTLWEPGHTEVVYLSVKNIGSLALKYQLGINIVSETGSINKDGNPFKLSQFIDFGVKDPAPDTKYETTEAAISAVNDSAKKISAGFTKANTLEANDPAEIVALVVYMPTTVTNEANYKTGEAVPQINLGLNLVATQLASESDSFGNNYDALATFPNGFYTAPQENFSESSNETTFSFENDTETVKISGTTEADKDVTASITPTTPHDNTNAFSLKSEGVDVVSYDIKVENYTDEVTIEIFVGKDLAGVEVYHNGVAMDTSAYSYDAATGYVTFKTSSFSIFDIALIVPTKIISESALTTALNEGLDVKLAADVELDAPIKLTGNDKIVLDLNGKTIECADIPIRVDGNTSLTLKNGNINSGVEVLGIFGDGKIYAENCIFTGKYCFGMNGTTTSEKSYAEFVDCQFHISSGYTAAYISAKGTYIFKNCVLEGGSGILIRSGAVTLDGCTIIANGYMGKGKVQPDIYANYKISAATDAVKDGVAFWSKSSQEGSTGDCIVIVDRSGSGYELKSVTIKNCKFEIKNSITSDEYTGPTGYAIRYYDKNNSTASTITPVVENIVDVNGNAIVEGNQGGYVYSKYVVE